MLGFICVYIDKRKTNTNQQCLTLVLKSILLIIVLLPINSFGQTWYYMLPQDITYLVPTIGPCQTNVFVTNPNCCDGNQNYDVKYFDSNYKDVTDNLDWWLESGLNSICCSGVFGVKENPTAFKRYATIEFYAGNLRYKYGITQEGNTIPSVNITVSKQNICRGSAVTFNAIPSVIEGSQTYQWLKNSNNISGATGSSYTTSLINNNDIISVELISEGCYSVNSNNITMTVYSPPTAPTSITGSPVCIGGKALLTATGGSSGSGCAYEWGTGNTIGNNIISGATSIKYTTTNLNSNATYWVRRVGNTSCTSKTTGVSQLVSIVADPTISTQPVSPSNVCVGGMFSETTVETAGGIQTHQYQWYSNSSNSYTGATSVAYANKSSNVPTAYTSGTKYYFCEVRSAGIECNVVKSNIVSATTVPDPYFTTQPTGSTICSGGSASLSVNAAGSTNGLTFQWQFYNGTTWVNVSSGTPTGASYSGATNTNLSVAGISAVGLYNYQCFVTGAGNGCGNATSNTAAITVVDDPTWATNSVSPASICAGGQVTFSATVSGGSGGTVSWIRSTTPGGSGTTVTSPYTESTAGTFYYRPRYSATVSGCDLIDGTQTAVTVYSDPGIDAIQVSPATICAGGTSDIIAVPNSGHDMTFQWQYSASLNGTYANVSNGSPSGATYSSTTTDLTVSGITTAGTYYYRLSGTSTCNGCTSPVYSTALSLTVVADPSAPTATKSPNYETVCAGQTLTLISVLNNGGGTGTCNIQYCYSTNGGSSYTTWNNTLPSFAATGSDNRIKIRKNCDGSGCDLSSENTYTWAVVADPSAPTATKSPNVATVCEGQTLTLTGVTDNGGGTGTCTVQYSQNGGAYSTTLPSFTAIAGTNTIAIKKVCNGSGCGESSVTTYSWDVVADPTITTQPTGGTICSGGTHNLSIVAAGGISLSYKWYKDGSFISGATGSTYGATTTGDYYCTVSSTGSGCGTAQSNTVRVTVNPTPTLTGVSQEAAVCANSAATINLTGLVANSTSTVSYTINGAAKPAAAGVVANASGVANFTTAVLTAANNGQTLQVTDITTTSTTPNCSKTFNDIQTQLSVNAAPGVPGDIAGDRTQCPGLSGQTYSITEEVANAGLTWEVPADWAITGGQGTVSIEVTTGSAGQNGDIKVTAENSCGSSYSTLPVTVNALPTLSNVNTSCSSDFSTYSISFTTNGVVTLSGYTVDNGSINGIPAGTDVTLTVTLNGCMIEVTVTHPICFCPTINPPVAGTVEPICEGDNIPLLTVSVGDNETADWYDAQSGGNLLASGTTSYSPEFAGTYYAVARNILSGCTSSTRTAVALTINDLPTLTIGDATCSADYKSYSVPFSSNGTVRNGSGNVVSSPIEGIPISENITLTATLGGCSRSETVTSPNCICPDVPAPTGSDRAICANESDHTLTVTVGDGLTADWYDSDSDGNLLAGGTTSDSPEFAGTYYAVARNILSGCTSSTRTAVALTINDLPTLTIGDATCSADYKSYSVPFSSNGTVRNGSGNVVSSPIEGIPISENITLTATLGGCSRSETVTSPNCICPDVPAPTGSDRAICANESDHTLTVTVGDGLTADWYDSDSDGNLLAGGTTSYSPEFAGTYYTVARDILSGCTSSTRTSVILTISPLPSAPTVNLEHPTCTSSTGKITVTSPTGTGFTYSKDGIDYSNTTGIFDVTAGDYTVTARNSDGCVSDGIVVTIVSQPQTPDAPTGSSTQAYCSSEGKKVSDLTATLTGSNIKWYDAAEAGNAISETELLSTGNYFASQTNGDCESTSRLGVLVTVNPNVTAGTVSGVSTLCVNATATFTSDGTTGGSWSSTNPGVASINPVSGEVTAVSTGSTDIRYTVSSGCDSPVISIPFTIEVSPLLTFGIDDSKTTCGATTGTIELTGLVEGKDYEYQLVPKETANPDAFIMQITVSAGQTIEIPFFNEGTYNGTIDWKDGKPKSTITHYYDIDRQHTYTDAGDYNIEFSGTFPGFKFWNSGSASIVKKIIQWGNVGMSLNTNAFYGCSNLSNIGDFENFSGSNIGNSVFYGCSSLTSVTIPSSITSIGDYAFRGCSSLTLVTIPSSVISIGSGAFVYCSALKSITIPSSITSIGYVTFCSTGLTSINIPSSVKSIGNQAFANCSALTSINIPSSVTSIDYGAFQSCSALTSITIPSAVTKLEPSLFYNCTALTSLTIPSSVTSIGDRAIQNCSALTNFICNPSTPPIITGYNFSNFPANLKIIVPSISVTAYKTASYWWQLADHIVSQSEPVELTSGYQALSSVSPLQLEETGTAPSTGLPEPTTEVSSMAATSEEPVWIDYPGSIENLDPGSYTIQVREKNTTCTSTELDFTVDLKETPSTPTVNTEQPNCTYSTGKITITSPTGTGFTYSKDGTDYSNTTGIFDVTAGRSYTVTAKNSDGCVSEGTPAIIEEQPSTPLEPVTTVTQPNCTTATGEITVAVQVPGESYSFDNGENFQLDNTKSDIAEGDYAVIIRSTGGCNSPVKITKVNPQPSAPNAPMVGYITQPKCAGEKGSVVLSGLPDGNWIINPGEINGSGSNTILSGLAPGSYYYTVTNEEGCTSPLSTEVKIDNQPLPVELIAEVIQGESYPDLKQGVVLIKTMSGGTAPLVLTLNGETVADITEGNTISGLNPDNYQLLVTDFNNCLSTPYDFNITENNDLTFSVEPQTPETCDGNSSIKVKFTENPDYSSYEYKINGYRDWTSMPANAIITGIKGGNYILSIRDGDYIFPSTVSFSLTTYEPVGFDLGSEVVECARNGIILVNNLTGGVAPYDYLLTSDQEKLGGTVTILGVEYPWVKVGNQYWLAANLHYNDGGVDETSVNESNGYFTWDAAKQIAENIEGWRLPSQSDFAELAAFAGTEENAGKNLKAVESWNPDYAGTDQYGFNAQPAGQILSSGLSAQGSECFFWSAESFTSNNETLGIARKISNEETNFPVDYGARNLGRSVRLIKEQGTPVEYEGTWNRLNENYQIPIDKKGTYNVVIRDAHGCKPAENSVTLEMTPAVEFSTYTPVNAKCHGEKGSIMLKSAWGGTNIGFEYNLDNTGWVTFEEGKTIEIEPSTSEYKIIVHDNNGCESLPYPFRINQPDEITVTWTPVISKSYEATANGSITIDNISGGNGNPHLTLNSEYYQYSSDMPPITGIRIGQNELYAIDQKGCSSTLYTVNIEQIDSIRFDASEETGTCDLTGKAELQNLRGGSSRDGMMYQLNQGSQETLPANNTIDPISQGDYTLILSDKDGNKSAIHRFSIHTTTPITFEVTDLTQKCDYPGKIAIRNVSGGSGSNYSYTLSTEDTPDFSRLNWYNCTTLPDAEATQPMYYVWVKDGTDCISEKHTVNVDVRNPVEANILNKRATVFSGTGDKPMTFVSASGGYGPVYDYSLDNGSTWNIFTTEIVANNLPFNSYTFIAKDIAGCQSKPFNFTVSQNSELAIHASVSKNASCYNYTDGEITIESITGGTEIGYKYSINGQTPVPWTTSVPSQPLKAGTYKIKAYDSFNQESEEIERTISQPNEVTFSGYEPFDATCFNGTGSFSIGPVYGGDGQFTHYLDNQVLDNFTDQGGTKSSLFAGIYQYHVEDGAGCRSITQQIIINQPSEIRITASATDQIVCNGDKIPILIETITGRENNYDLFINQDIYPGPIANGTQISGFEAGTYHLKVVDHNHCQSNIVELIITQPDKLLAIFEKAANVQCNGGNQGKVLLTNLSGRTGQRTLFINGEEQNDVVMQGMEIPNLEAGYYEFKIKDGQDCWSNMTPITVEEPTPISISYDLLQNVSCKGGSDGKIKINISGGTIGSIETVYQISTNFVDWTDFDPLNPTMNLNAGTHKLWAKTAYCYSLPEDVFIDDGNQISVTTNSISPVSCFGKENGSALLTVTGNVSDRSYSYKINGEGNYDFSSGSTADGLKIGVNTIDVEDNKGCKATHNLSIGEVYDVNFSITNPTDTKCDPYQPTGTVTIANLRGGTGSGYQYSLDELHWEDVPYNKVIGQLNKGLNNITIKDNSPDGGCQSKPKQVTIEASETLTYEKSTVDVTCYNDHDGILNINNVSGSLQTDYEYSFDANGSDWTTFDNSFTILNLGGEERTIFIQSVGDHCGTASIDYTIKEPNPLLITEAKVLANCDGTPAQSLYEKLRIKVQGGNDDEKYKYNIFADSWIEFTGTSTEIKSFSKPQEFILKVRDHKLCTAETPMISIDRTEILRFKHQSIDARCASGSGKDQITEITGGSMLGWEYWLNNDGWKPLNANLLIRGIPADLNDLRIKDDANCVSDFESFIIDGNGDYKVNKGKYIPPVCAGEKASFSIYDVDGETGGAFEYSIETPANWTPFKPPHTIENIGTGTYEIRIKDTDNCETVVDQLDVPTFYDPFTVTYTIDRQPICITDNAVPAQITLTDGWSDDFTQFKNLEYQLNRDGIWNEYDGTNTLPLSLKQGTNYIQIRDQIDLGNSQSVSCWSNDIELKVNAVPKITCDYELDLSSCSTIYTNLIIKSIKGGIGSSYHYRLIGVEAPAEVFNFENIEPYNPDNNDTLKLFEGNYTLEIHDGNNECNKVSYEFNNIVKKTILKLEDANLTITNATCIENGSVLLKNVIGGCGYGYSGKLERIDETTTPVSEEIISTKILEEVSGQGKSATFEEIQAEPDPKIKYNIFVTDGKGCVSNKMEVDIKAQEDISFDLSEPKQVCKGGKGTVTVSKLKGGTNTNFKYNLTTVAPIVGSSFTVGTSFGIDSSITNLDPGKYYLTIKDESSDCYPVTKSFTITEVEPIKVLYAYRNATNGGSSQSIAFGVFGKDEVTTNYSIKPENATQWKNLSEIIPASYFYGSNSLKVRKNEGDLVVWDIPVSDIPIIDLIRIQGDNFKQGMICFRANQMKKSLVYEISLNGDTPSTFTLSGFNYLSDNPAINLGDNTITITGPKGIECDSVSGTFSIKTSPPDFLLTLTDPINETIKGTIKIHTITGGCGSVYKYKLNYDDWKEIPPSTNTIEINDLEAGPYWVKIKDAFGSESTTKTAQLSYKLSARIELKKAVSCKNSSDAILLATPLNERNGGEITYQWFEKSGVNWSKRTETTSEISGLPKGEYKVVVTETVTGQEKLEATDIFILNEPAELGSSFEISDVSCFGGNNGEVSITVNGGTPPYRFKHDDEFNSNNSFGGLVAKDYFFDVMDANNCTYTTPEAIIEGPVAQLIYTPTVVSPTTYNGADGTLNVNVTGGTSPYMVQLKNPVGIVVAEKTKNTTSNGYEVYYEGLKAGIYAIEITDNNYLPNLTGCSINDQITINNPEIIQIESISTTNPTCSDDENGSILLKVKGGSSITDNSEGYNFIWKYTNADNETSDLDFHGHEATGLIAGDYNITITDKVGATISVSERLEDPEPFNLKIDDFHDISCKDGLDGSITISYNERVGTNVYLNDKPVSSKTFGNLAAGEYTFKVENNNFCIEEKTQLLQEPAEPLKMTLTTTDPQRTVKGKIEATITGGRKNYLVKLWSVDANKIKIEPPVTNTSSGESVTFPDLSTGDYWVEVTDNMGASNSERCVVESAAKLYPSSVLTGEIEVVEKFGCNSSGLLRAIPHGGNKNLNYTYKWTINNSNNSKGSKSEIIVEREGTYNVQIKNGSLTWNGSITITKPVITIIPENIVYVSCKGGNNGQIKVNATGGTEPYQYLWTGNATTQNLTNLSKGVYSLTVTDSKGCSSKPRTFTVEEPKKAFSIVLNNNKMKYPSSPTFNNGEIWINKINENEGWGNFNYTLSGPEGDIPFNGISAKNLGYGNYMLTVTSTRGADISSEEVICTESKVINLSEAKFTFDIDMKGNYVCTETENLRLEAKIITDLNQNQFSYKWYKLIDNEFKPFGANNKFVNNVSQGIYKLEVTAPTGVKLDKTVTFIDPNMLSIKNAVAENVTGIGEHDGAITLNTTGGAKPYSFYWRGGIIIENRTNLGPGNYNVTVKDHNNCTVDSTFTITVPPLSVEISNPVPLVCKYHSNGTLYAKARGGAKIVPGNYNYEWSKLVGTEWSPVQGNQPELSNRGVGTYKVEVTDANNNMVDDVFEIKSKSNLEVLVSSTNGDCKGNLGYASATAANGFGSYTYLWSNQANTPVITNMKGGKYDLRVTDELGCQSSTSTTIKLAGELGFSETVTPYTCPSPPIGTGPNGAIAITINGGSDNYNYEWINAETNQTIKTGSENSLPNLSKGHYILNVNDLTPNYHCNLTRAYQLAEAPLLEQWFNHIPQSAKICFETGITIPEVKLDQTGALYSWKWNLNKESADPLLFITESGNYNLQVTDVSGCKWEKNISVDKSQFLIDAEFLLPSASYLNDVITIVNTSHVGVTQNLSYEQLDRLTWIVWKGTSLVTDEAQVIESTNHYISLKFVQPGEYRVELIIEKGECTKVFTKTVLVDENERPQQVSLAASQPLIISFVATPNPVENDYKVSLEFSRVSPAYLYLHDYSGNFISSEPLGDIEKDWAKLYSSTLLRPGVYVLSLITPYEQRSIKLIKQ